MEPQDAGQGLGGQAYVLTEEALYAAGTETGSFHQVAQRCGAATVPHEVPDLDDDR